MQSIGEWYHRPYRVQSISMSFRVRYIRACAILFAVMLAGCESAPKDSGFSDVKQLARERAGAEIQRSSPSADNAEIESTVNQMLAHELSPDQAVQIALLKNPSLQAVYSRLDIARADLIQAGLLKNPVFDASVRFPDRAPRGPDVELSISQEFIDLLLMPLRSKLAAAEFEEAKIEVAGAVVDRARPETRRAYYTLAGSQQMLALHQRAVEAMRLSAETAQHLRDAGNLNDLNLATEQAAYEQGRVELDTAAAEVEQNRLALAQSMGIDGGRIFSIAAELADPVEVPGVDELEAQAQSQRLDLRAAKQALSVAKHSAKLTQTTGWLSSASLGVDTERMPDGQHVTGPTFSFPIPLFDFGQAARLRADAEWTQAAWQYQALRFQVASDVRMSAAKMSESRARYEHLHAAIVPLRLKIAQESLLQYNGMLMDVLQLLNARQLHFEARRNAIAALRDYWIARAELEPRRSAAGNLPTTRPASQPAAHGD